jgi:nucleotide-binding universal stress UspA family protein
LHFPGANKGALDLLIEKDSEAIKNFYEAIETNLEGWKQRVVAQGLNASWLLKEGPVLDKVLEACNELNIDLICNGLIGEQNSTSHFGGSLTQSLIRSALCPVFVAKQTCVNFQPKRMVFTSTFYKENLEIMARVAEFARLFDAELHLLKVNTPGDFERSAYSIRVMEDLAAEARVTDYKAEVVNDFQVEDGVYWYAASRGIDCICMSTHSRKGIAQLLNSSIAEEVGSEANVPVLIYRLKEHNEGDGVIFPD